MLQFFLLELILTKFISFFLDIHSIKKCFMKKKRQDNKIDGKKNNKTVKSEDTPYIKNNPNIGKRLEIVTVVSDYEQNFKIII